MATYTVPSELAIQSTLFRLFRRILHNYPRSRRFNNAKAQLNNLSAIYLIRPNGFSDKIFAPSSLDPN